MTTVSQLCQYLLVGTARPEALALGHFLENYYSPNETVNEETFDRFFRRAYSFSYWREQRSQLQNELRPILTNIARLHCPLLNVEKAMESADLQVIAMENARDVKEIIARYLEPKMKDGDRFRLLPLPTGRVLALTLLKEGDVRVSLFTNQMTVRSGQICPLLDDMHLVYGNGLEIAPDQIQHVEVAPNTFCRFKVTERGYNGFYVRGYTFQRFETLGGGPLLNHPRLFYPLKRIEQFFISRKSDPLYLELTSTLERVTQLVRHQEPDAPRIAQAALKRAQNAYEHIFSEDRLLGLLIRDLTRLLPLSQEDDKAPGAET